MGKKALGSTSAVGAEVLCGQRLDVGLAAVEWHQHGDARQYVQTALVASR